MLKWARNLIKIHIWFKSSFESEFCRQKQTSRHFQASTNAAKRMEGRSKIDFAHVKTYVQDSFKFGTNIYHFFPLFLNRKMYSDEPFFLETILVSKNL